MEAAQYLPWAAAAPLMTCSSKRVRAGFSLRDISMPVHVWHGEEDRLVPIEQGRIQANAIPNAIARFFPNKGHTLGVNHANEILELLAAE